MSAVHNLHYEKFADGSVKCIKDEIPFDLPEGWAWERLSNLAAFSGGKTPSTSHLEYWGGDVLWITSKDMKSKYITSSQLRLSVLGAEQMQIYQRDTLLLVTRSGILRHTLPVSILKECATINQDLKAIVLHMPQLAEYIYSCLKAMEAQLLLKYTKSGTTVENVNFDEFQKVLLPIPPTQQIDRIISATGDAERVISTIEDDKAALAEYIVKAKAKILDLAIRGQLVPQDPADEPASVLLERIRAEKEELIRKGKIKRDKKESVIFRGEDNSYYEKMADGKLHCLDNQLPFELPDGWEWCNLSMIGTTNIGLTYRPTDIEPGGIMVLRSCNIVNDQVDLSDLVRVKTAVRENQFAQKNDILICARNGSRSLVGKCALIPDLGEPASFGAFMAIYRTEYFEFIVHYLRSSFFRSVFDDSNSTAINQLTQDMLKRAIVPLPPLSEQRRIVEAIDAMLFELNQIEKGLS
ncbi:restriction endonuclease subunit S [Oscillibacter valericigenes]|uniref:restriction endonuclease subunit S n=1 Tax=Oscillibacter valericigenes TaxID=351091 RepID=UPI001F240124|nr:restriction endonuclease subunit S [Oscillibacter valericigenes]MCF2617833.1 restriction endonuclease subunit S [Oscillibacter valericigenes]